MQESIGIAITTRNRKESFNLVKSKITEFMPDNSFLFCIDDASDIPYANPCFRFDERVGIPKVKNKCLELLILSAGVDHLFLFDDDCYPLTKDWHIPYVNSPYNLMCYTWYNPIHNDGTHKYHLKGHGCMMYINKSIVESIGGFDTTFGLGKYEHTAYFERSYNAGLVPYPFIDAINSNKLFHSMDEHGEIDRSFSSEENSKLLKDNLSHYNKTKNDKYFIPYI
ncbi:MAG: hypothetical protein LBF27_25875 [Sphingobacterium sp.]|jgi:hypothetical protein|nr:hypothetical protein [Sphingobacterium sp.]